MAAAASVLAGILGQLERQGLTKEASAAMEESIAAAMQEQREQHGGQEKVRKAAERAAEADNEEILRQQLAIRAQLRRLHEKRGDWETKKQEHECALAELIKHAEQLKLDYQEEIAAADKRITALDAKRRQLGDQLLEFADPEQVEEAEDDEMDEEGDGPEDSDFTGAETEGEDGAARAVWTIGPERRRRVPIGRGTAAALCRKGG